LFFISGKKGILKKHLANGRFLCKIFITDGHWRKTLAAVRALGEKGISVSVGESTRLATACFSKYCGRTVVYPSPLQSPSKFISFIKKELSRHTYQMLLPMEDETLGLIAKHHTEFIL